MAKLQRLQWYEPPEFSQAKARTESSGSSTLSFFLIALVFSIVLFIVSPPEDITEFGVVVLLALTVASAISLFTWAASRAPKNVSLGEDTVVIGGDTRNLADLAYAVVGTTTIGEVEFPVLRIQTRDGQTFIAGLTSKMDPAELILAFEERGVLVK